MICHHKVLYHSPKGLASYCQQCSYIQIAFGTTVVSFSENQFTEFCDYIQHFFPTYKGAYHHHKAIYLPINSQNIGWILTAQELRELRTMLRIAQERFALLRLAHDAFLSPN